MKYIFISIAILAFQSCKTGTNSDKPFKADDKKALTFRLHIHSGDSLMYNIVSENALKIDLNTKTIDNSTRAEIMAKYIFTSNPAGGYFMNISYSKIHLNIKNGDETTDLETDNPASSDDQMGKMLRFLLEANLSAQLGPLGDVESVNGYKELGSKIIGGFAGSDNNSKKIMQDKWNQVIGEGIIKKNISDLFSYFPKKAIHEGDSWTTHSIQKTDIPLDVSTTYKTKSVEDSFAYLKSESEIIADSTLNYMGTEVLASLKGDQEGSYTINMNTGMLIQSHSALQVKGSLQIMGRDFPVKMSSEVTIKQVSAP